MTAGEDHAGAPRRGAGASAAGSYSTWQQQRQEDRTAKLERRRHAKELYSHEGAPALRTSFVAYLDSLGTKDAAAAFDDTTLASLLADTEELAWFLHDEDSEDYRQRVLTFSDNVAVGSPVDPTYGDLGLFNTVFNVATYQMNRVARGRFLRGGIALGSLYMDDRIIVGQALVDAVLLEERVASAPRVVVAEQALVGVPTELGYYADPWSSPHNRFLIHNDDQVIVNYLGVLEEDTGWDPDSVPQGLSLHRDLVVANLEEHRTNDHIRAKYEWAADYHNWACTAFFDYPDLTLPSTAAAEERVTATFALLVPTRNSSEPPLEEY